MERVYSYNPGARTGLLNANPALHHTANSGYLAVDGCVPMSGITVIDEYSIRNLLSSVASCLWSRSSAVFLVPAMNTRSLQPLQRFFVVSMYGTNSVRPAAITRDAYF